VQKSFHFHAQKFDSIYRKMKKTYQNIKNLRQRNNHLFKLEITKFILSFEENTVGICLKM
jgi:hypothetical protein